MFLPADRISITYADLADIVQAVVDEKLGPDEEVQSYIHGLFGDTGERAADAVHLYTFKGGIL
jgi:hypothetical protein